MCKTLFPTMTRTLSLFISVTYQKVNKFRIHNGLQAGYIRGLTICRQQRNIQSIKFRTCTTNRFLPLASSPLACTAKGFCTLSSKLSLRTHTTFPPGNSLNEDIDLIAVKLKNELKNVLVVAGAGLSTPSGIPDFRSPGSGIYDNIQKYKLPYPEAIFDIEYFRAHPQPFNTWSKEFLPGVNYQPSIGHYFIRLLQDKNKLLRHFTQNIDGLEVLAGVKEENIVAAHGSFSTASCIYCKKPADFQKVKTAILNEETPHCQECGGLVKPDIVFFGEMLPERFWIMRDRDVHLTDLLICIGTSLEVYPFAGVADAVPESIPRLLINRDLVGSFGTRENDHHLSGDLVKNLELLVDKLGWTEEMQKYLEQS